MSHKINCNKMLVCNCISDSEEAQMRTVDELANDYWTKRHVEDPNAERTEDAFKAGYSAAESEVNRKVSEAVDYAIRESRLRTYDGAITELQSKLAKAEAVTAEMEKAIKSFMKFGQLEMTMIGALEALEKLEAYREGK